MNIVCNGKVLGRVPDRPVAPGAIVRYKGTNYNMASLEGAALNVVVRPGKFGQAATPDYDFDEGVEATYPHKFRVVVDPVDDYVGDATLQQAPAVGQKVTVNGKVYKVTDWSIGQRAHDELYVKEA